MWISRKKWEGLQQELNWHQCQLDALYERVREHELKINKNTDDIQNNISKIIHD